MRKFIEGLDWPKLRRDDAFLAGRSATSHEAGQRPMAAVAEDGSFAVIYVPGGGGDSAAIFSISLDLTRLSFKAADMAATIYAAATCQPAGNGVATDGVLTFSTTTPAAAKHTGSVNDWVLLLRKKQRQLEIPPP